MTAPETIGLLHPGAMGAAIGADLRAVGHAVLWCPEGRGAATATRAAAAGLQPCATLAELAARAGVVLSVCPPGQALATAGAVLAAGFRGVLVDANAVAPATVAALQVRADAAGTVLVDGGIIGPPPLQPGLCRLYLSGTHAARVAGLFAGTRTEAIVVAGPAGRASALKMAYAGWTKGSSALLLAVAAAARALGVEAELQAEWARSQPALARDLQRAVRGSVPKAWRFAGEMDEIAATLAAAGQPDGFHAAAAALYRRLAGFRDAEGLDVDAVLATLTGGGAAEPPDPPVR